MKIKTDCFQMEVIIHRVFKNNTLGKSKYEQGFFFSGLVGLTLL